MSHTHVISYLPFSKSMKLLRYRFVNICIDWYDMFTYYSRLGNYIIECKSFIWAYYLLQWKASTEK